MRWSIWTNFGYHSNNVATVNIYSPRKYTHVHLEHIPDKRINNLKILAVKNIKETAVDGKVIKYIALNANGKLIIVDDNYQIGEKLRSSYDFDEENCETQILKPKSDWKQLENLFSIENNLLFFDDQPVYIRGNVVNCSN